MLILALFIVDFISRRRSLLMGISLQIATLIYVGGYLVGTKNMTPEYIENSPTVSRTSTAAIIAIFLHAVAWSIG